MMSLFDLARSADTEVFVDTYGSATFNGQIMLYNESVRSGPASRRRIIETAPGVVIPIRRTVTEQESGQVYILADGAPDWYKGRRIAVKYPCIPVETTFSIRSIAQVLSTGGLTSVYAAPSYIRRVISEESSDYLGGYEIIYSPYYHPIQPGSIFYDGVKWYRSRELSRTDDIGLGVSEAVELINPLQTLAYIAKATTYDPIDDDFTPAASKNIQVFIEPLYLDFIHEVLGYVKPEVGDVALSVLKTSATIAPGEKVGTLTILSVADGGTVWTAHCRKHH